MTSPQLIAPSNPSIDATLAARLQEQLCQRFRGLRIRLENDGLVLEGRVRTYYMKQVAQELVMGLTDVPIVGNAIAVD